MKRTNKPLANTRVKAFKTSLPELEAEFSARLRGVLSIAKEIEQRKAAEPNRPYGAANR